MPYADPEKRRQTVLESKRRQRAREAAEGCRMVAVPEARRALVDLVLVAPAGRLAAVKKAIVEALRV